MEKSNFTILVDMDDTIENLLDAWAAYLDKKYNLKVKPKDITLWEIEVFFPQLTKAQVFEPLFADDFWETVKPKKDAMKYLQKLYDEGFNILLCTASDYAMVKEKFDKALFPYFPFFDSDHIIITNRKNIIKADVLVDDGIHNLTSGSYKKILFTSPVNKDFDAEKHRMVRVNNWKQAYDVIERMYQDELEKRSRKKKTTEKIM